MEITSYDHLIKQYQDLIIRDGPHGSLIYALKTLEKMRSDEVEKKADNLTIPKLSKGGRVNRVGSERGREVSGFRPEYMVYDDVVDLNDGWEEHTEEEVSLEDIIKKI